MRRPSVVDSSALTYAWSVSPAVGTFAPDHSSGTSDSVQFTCTSAGTATVTLVAADGPVPEGGACDPSLDTMTTTVTCVAVGDWLWKSTAPVSNTLLAVWASAPDDAWAVGHNGFAMHWDGTAWQTVPSGTISAFSGIWGSAANDIWATAGGFAGPGAFNLVHWDGNAWSPVAAGTPNGLVAIWGASSADVWAAALGGVIVHFDGMSWTPVQTIAATDLRSLSGTATNDVWAVGQPTGAIQTNDIRSILHFAGSGSWMPVADNALNPTAKILQSVWANTATDAWAAGQGEILRWDGTAWAPTSAPPDSYVGIWGRASNDLWASVATGGLRHWNGQVWTLQLTDQVLGVVGGLRAAVSGHSGVWAPGANAIFELVPGTALTCEAVGGTCGAPCNPGQGHVSDYACGSGGGTCCVSSVACGGPSEPVCCARTTPPQFPTLIPGLRPTCNDGEYDCGPNAFPSQSCNSI